MVFFFAAIASHPWWLAHWLGAYLSKTSGREVHFDRVRLGLTGALTPEVSFDGVRIANASWADASQPFAVLGQAVFQLAWQRYDGRWLVTRMILRDGEVHLLRQADGRRNWRLRDPEDRGPGHFWFQSLEPHRIALSFVHDGVAFELRSRASDLARRTTRLGRRRRSSTGSISTAVGAASPSRAAPMPEPSSPSSRAAAGSRCAAMPRFRARASRPTVAPPTCSAACRSMPRRSSAATPSPAFIR